MDFAARLFLDGPVIMTINTTIHTFDGVSTTIFNVFYYFSLLGLHASFIAFEAEVVKSIHRPRPWRIWLVLPR